MSDEKFDERLIDFIKDSLKQGISIEQIKNDLLSVGWKPELIEQALVEVQRNSTTSNEEIDEFSIHENLDSEEAEKLKASQSIQEEKTVAEKSNENKTEESKAEESAENAVDENISNDNDTEESVAVESIEESAVNSAKKIQDTSQEESQVIEQAVDAGKSLEERIQQKPLIQEKPIIPEKKEFPAQSIDFKNPEKKPVNKNIFAGLIAIIVLIILILAFWLFILPILK